MQCQFIKSNQNQCKANAMRDSEFCFTHNPKAEEAKRAAVIKGGESPKKNYNPLRPIKLNSNKSVVNLLATTINEVRQGEIDLRVANCIGYLSRHLIKALETANLEERICEIEKMIFKK